MTRKLVLTLTMLLLSHPMLVVADTSRDITSQFEVLFTHAGSYSVEDVARLVDDPSFEPLKPPLNVSRLGYEAWLRVEFPQTEQAVNYEILEIPGQIFNYIDVWFFLQDGEVFHYRAGDRYPYSDRAIKNSSYAFPIPNRVDAESKILIRARNETTHPMNFAAILWPAESWTAQQFALRLWFGIFLGGTLALAGYNLLLGVSLRDTSYFFYVGYVLSIVGAVVVLSGLAEEYLWPDGKPVPLVSTFNGLGTFFGIAFVNKFLSIRQRWPWLFHCSLAISVLAMLSGLWLAVHDTLPGIPDSISAALVQLLSLIGAVYFISVSIFSYIKGQSQARFLALGMGALLTSMVVYFSYTHAFLAYSVYLGRILELGALAEGMLLSLALADRVKILEFQKREAERNALSIEREYSKRLLFAQERERQSISEALHDSIGHSVLILGNKLEHARQVIAGAPGGGSGMSQELILPIKMCRELMSDIRRLSHDLHPHILERLGLAAALESTFTRAFEGSETEWQLKVEDPFDVVLSDEISLAIYRVVQETLTNILKYAAATQVSCNINIRQKMLECSISDNGVGFDVEAINSDSLGIQESSARVAMLGGKYSVSSNPGAGSLVSMEIPLH